MIQLKAPMVHVRIEARHLVIATLLVAAFLTIRYFGII